MSKNHGTPTNKYERTGAEDASDLKKQRSMGFPKAANVSCAPAVVPPKFRQSAKMKASTVEKLATIHLPVNPARAAECTSFEKAKSMGFAVPAEAKSIDASRMKKLEEQNQAISRVQDSLAFSAPADFPSDPKDETLTVHEKAKSVDFFTSMKKLEEEMNQAIPKDKDVAPAEDFPAEPAAKSSTVHLPLLNSERKFMNAVAKSIELSIAQRSNAPELETLASATPAEKPSAADGKEESLRNNASKAIPKLRIELVSAAAANLAKMPNAREETEPFYTPDENSNRTAKTRIDPEKKEKQTAKEGEKPTEAKEMPELYQKCLEMSKAADALTKKDAHWPGTIWKHMIAAHMARENIKIGEDYYQHLKLFKHSQLEIKLFLKLNDVNDRLTKDLNEEAVEKYVHLARQQLLPWWETDYSLAHMNYSVPWNI